MINRLIVSFTTSPERINHIAPVIDCICNKQTVKPDCLKLYIPKKFSRTGQEYIVPESILELEQQLPNFKIQRVDEDKGPITKVCYAFQEYTDPNDIIILIDDDVVYDSHFIQEFIDAHKERPNAVMSFIGCDPPRRPFIHAEHIQRGHTSRVYVDVRAIGGYRGVLFPRKVIQGNFFDILDAINALHHKKINRPLLEDDNFISFYCRTNKIPLHVIGTFYTGNLNSSNFLDQLNFKFLESSNINSLYDTSNTNNMKESYNILDDYFAKL